MKKPIAEQVPSTVRPSERRIKGYSRNWRELGRREGLMGGCHAHEGGFSFCLRGPQLRREKATPKRNPIETKGLHFVLTFHLRCDSNKRNWSNSNNI